MEKSKEGETTLMQSSKVKGRAVRSKRSVDSRGRKQGFRSGRQKHYKRCLPFLAKRLDPNIKS